MINLTHTHQKKKKKKKKIRTKNNADFYQLTGDECPQRANVIPLVSLSLLLL